MKKFSTCLVAVFFALFAAACGGEKAGGESAAAGESFTVITDDAGRSVTLDAKPNRIAVTSASFLEPLYAVGGDVIARPDSKTKMPPQAKDKTSIGKVYAIDTEALLAAKPDLVIINKGMNEKLLPALEETKIPAVVIDMKSYDDVKNEIKIFAAITGEKGKGDQLIADMDAKINSVQQKIPTEKINAVIIHSTNQGLTVQLDESIAGSIAKMLGIKNAASGMTPLENNPAAAPYSMETLVEQNPDIIFVTSMGNIDEIKKGMEETINENPAWQTIPAVKNGRLYYLPQDLFLLSPGIHYPDAAEYMAKLVWPTAFGE